MKRNFVKAVYKDGSGIQYLKIKLPGISYVKFKRCVQKYHEKTP